MSPQMHHGMGGLSDHAAVPASTGMSTKREASTSPGRKYSNVFNDIPDAKKRKFVVVNDAENGNKGVRVRFNLNEVDIEEIPDSYREKNSMFPRSWYPVQMQLSPGSRADRRGRFVESRDEDVEDGDDGEALHVGHAMVKVPMLEGREGKLKVPGLGRRAKRREERLNEMGYRLIWGARKVMSDRVVFAQKSCESSFRHR